MSPYAVPAIRKRRVGYVWHGAEQNQPLASVNERASEYANGSTSSVQYPIGCTSSTERTKPSILPSSICSCVAFQLCETCWPCAVVVKGNERTGPVGPGLLLSATPELENFSPCAFGWPECAMAPMRLSKEWFSIITTTMWSKGIAALTVPAGRPGSGRLSGGRIVAAAAESVRHSVPPPDM